MTAPKHWTHCSVFTIRNGEWQIVIRGRVLPIIWHCRGAALAGLAVELRREKATGDAA